MANTIVGLYEDLADAENVVRGLQKAGFPRDDISLVSREGREMDRELSATAHGVGLETGRDAAAGAMIGGIAGLLVGLGALLIPGIGPIIAAGPLATALAGAGVGAVAGGLTGVLTRAGVPEEAARAYAEGVRRGGTLVMVSAPEAEADRAVAVMNQYSPIEIDTKANAEAGSLSSLAIDALRAPSDHPLPDHEMDLAFQEQTFEVTATDEELIVNKRAQVVEEVIVSKSVEERPETVAATVQRTEVETEELQAGETRPIATHPDEQAQRDNS